MSDLQEEEILVFVDAVTQYLTRLTTEPPEVRGAYLAAEQARPPSLDYTGVIICGVGYQGCVYFSAPSAMLRHLLIAQGESDHKEENLLDLVGEVANTVAGNARRRFGEQMHISVPVTIAGAMDSIRPKCRTRPYIITVRWKSYNALLVVDIDRK